MQTTSKEKLKKATLNVCRGIASLSRTTAVCLYGQSAHGLFKKTKKISVLMVIEKFQEKLSYYTKKLDENSFSILVVDREVFEEDVEQGSLGEFVSGVLLTLYEPLINAEYLRRQEVEVKKRVVRELLKNVILEFPELSYELHIKPEYFMNEVMLRKAKLFPPATYGFFDAFFAMPKNRLDVKKSIMSGYMEAIKKLEDEKLVVFSEGYVRINHSFIDATKKTRALAPKFFRKIRRTLLLQILKTLPKVTSWFVQDEELVAWQLEETEKYLFVPTSLGLVSLSDKTTIKDFVRKIAPNEKFLKIEVAEIGGVLNSVYLLVMGREKGETRKVVVKKFKEWLGLKWFPLTLWTLGTQSFAVLGESRLEREYSINQFLKSRGFNVPKILYVSPRERLIFEEYIEGESLAEVIKRLIYSKEDDEERTDLIERSGEEIARIHSLGVTIGDCKPENVLVAKDGRLYFVDLEQATRNGDQSWDVAEFLYYAGHYVPPVSPARPAEKIAEAFIKGYLKAGGKEEVVRRAGSAKYTKTFSVFTPPHVIFAISSLCKKLGREGSA